MKFSVLMSVYGKDDPDYFREAIESVTIKQTLRPNQMVVVLDGPVPNNVKVLISQLSEANKDIEFTTVDKEKNAGLAAALNSGIAVCKYEWIARMDSDDISVQDRFYKQVQYIKQHKNLDVLGGTISEFEKLPGDLQSERHVKLKHDEIIEMAKTRTPFNHVTVFYRKSSVQKAGCYSEDFGKLEDYKLWVDLIVSGAKFANIPDVIVYVRVGAGFIERRSNKREITDWDMLQKHLLAAGLIGKMKSIKNKLYIRAFIYMPGWMKRIAYNTVLRGKS